MENIVLAIQVVERRHRTINYSTRKLHNVGATCRNKKSKGPRSRTRGYAAAHIGQKVTIEVTIHNGMLDLRLNGAGGRHLRCNLWASFGKIFCQESINEIELEGTTKFKFKKRYKIQRIS